MTTPVHEREAKLDPLSLPAEAFASAWVGAGEPGGRVAALARFADAFRRGVMDGPGAPVRVAPVSRVHTSESGEGTVLKFTQRLEAIGGRGHAEAGIGGTIALPLADAPVEGGDGAPAALETESVLIPMIGKKRERSYTLCVSSQIGCAMGCAFCQTAQMGLIRSLTVSEIVGQWYAARWLVERPDPSAEIRNIVFMGMGEPTDNLENVIGAIRVLTDNRGPAIAMCRVTISTVGRVDGIRRLMQQVREPGWHRMGMAISVNAPSDEVRSKIMPINRTVPMAELRAALEEWPTFGSSHLCLEYVVIPGVNDSMRHADELAAWVRGDAFEPGHPEAAGVARWSGKPLRGLVNLIPYNPRERSPWASPSEEAVDAFLARLKMHYVYAKRRRTKGRDTMAACGQLGNPELRRVRAR